VLVRKTTTAVAIPNMAIRNVDVIAQAIVRLPLHKAWTIPRRGGAPTRSLRLVGSPLVRGTAGRRAYGLRSARRGPHQRVLAPRLTVGTLYVVDLARRPTSSPPVPISRSLSHCAAMSVYPALVASGAISANATQSAAHSLYHLALDMGSSARLAALRLIAEMVDGGRSL
jgi:hypothetical protein